MTEMVKVVVARYKHIPYPQMGFADLQEKMGETLAALPYWDWVSTNYKISIEEMREAATQHTVYYLVAEMTKPERTMFLLKWGDSRSENLNG
jgi:hypothetical protein